MTSMHISLIITFLTITLYIITCHNIFNKGSTNIPNVSLYYTDTISVQASLTLQLSKEKHYAFLVGDRGSFAIHVTYDHHGFWWYTEWEDVFYKELIEHSKAMFTNPPERIVYAYTEYQPVLMTC